jgi:hypothetical protein
MNSPQLIQKSISDVIGFSQDKQKPPVDSLETFSSETTLTGDSLSTNGGAMSWTKLIKLRKLIVSWIAHSN